MNTLIVLCTTIYLAAAAPVVTYTPYGAVVLPYASAPIYHSPIIAPAPVYHMPIIPGAPSGIKTQFYTQDLAGQVSYGYAQPGQAQSVLQDAAGNKVGSFSFIDAEGKLVQANFVADALGYRLIANNIPKYPAENPQPQQQQTQQIQPTLAEDTMEIAEAKAKYFAQMAAEEAQKHNKQSTNPGSSGPQPLNEPSLANMVEPAGNSYSNPVQDGNSNTNSIPGGNFYSNLSNPPAAQMAAPLIAAAPAHIVAAPYGFHFNPYNPYPLAYPYSTIVHLSQ